MKSHRAIGLTFGLAIVAIAVAVLFLRNRPNPDEPQTPAAEAHETKNVAVQPETPNAIAVSPETPESAPVAEASSADAPAKARAGFAAIYGKAIFPDDAPQGLAVTVSLHTADPMGPPDQVTELKRMQADTDSTYKFSDLPLRRYVVYADADGYSGDTNVSINDYERNAFQAWTFLVPSGTISGRVVNEAHEPVPGAQVFVVAQHLDGWKVPATPERSFASRQTTDADGRFAMPRLRRLFNGEPGYRLGVKAEGYAPFVSDFVATGKQDAEFVLNTGGVITGRIVDAESGEPLPSMSIAFASEFIFETHTAQSDAEGFFFVSAVRPGIYVAGLKDQELVVTPESATIAVQESGADAELKVAHGGGITGRVTQSETGEGIGNATLTALFGRERINIRRAQTDVSGAYRFAGLPPGAYTVTLQHVRGFSHVQPNGESQARRVSVPLRDTVAGVDFAAERGLRVSGVFVDETGKPVPGVSVTGYADNRGMQSYSFSDERGAFVLAGFEPDTEARFQIEYHGYALLESPLSDMKVKLADADVTGLKFVMGVPSSISGIVVDEQGRPKKHVYLRARNSSNPSRPGAGANSNVRGEFTMESLSPGSYVLQFGDEKAQLPESEAPVVTVARGEKSTGVRMIFRGGGGLTISGRVMDARGLPLYNASVQVEGDNNNNATTDTNGQFTLESVSEGTHTLNASADVRSVSQTAKAGDTGVVITLKDPATVSGQVVDAVTNQPVPIFTINAIIVRDAEGRFEVTNLQEGTTRVGVVADGYASATFTIPPVRAGEQRREVIFRIEPAVHLSGRVTDAAGKSIAGASVSVEAAQTTTAAGSMRFSPVRTTSLADGQFTLGPLPARLVTVRASYKGYRNASADVTLVRGGANRTDLTLTIGAVIEGVVTANGRPVARGTVRAQSESTNNGGDARTDAQGRYRITGLNDGAYRVTASLPDSHPAAGRSKTIDAAISGTASVTANIAFKIEGGSVSGRVYRLGGEVVRGAQLQLESEPADGTREFMRTQTDDNGEYVFTGVSAGSVLVQLFWEDINRRARFTLTEGEQVRKDFHLDGGTTVRVELTGEASTRARNVMGVLYEGEVTFPELSETAMEQFQRVLLEIDEGENGSIELGPVEPGTYTVLVAAGDFSESNPDGTIPADWTTQVVQIDENTESTLVLRVNL